VTYELRIERVIDGPRESVFDAFVDADPEAPVWTVTSQLVLQVAGKWTIDFGSRHPLEHLAAGRVST
jgi:uncharacterized protein YndB with AHSA1/START domain